MGKLALGVALLVAGALFTIVLPPLLAGWRELSRLYPPTSAVPTRSPFAVAPYVGLLRVVVWAGVGSNRDGLYFEPVFPASLFVAPVFLPWAEITERNAGVAGSFKELRGTRCPRVAIYLLAG